MCIHRRCSLAVERRTRNAKVPSSTLGSAFCQKVWQPLPPLLLFCSLPRFSLPAPFPSRGDLCTTRAYARPGFSGRLCFSTHEGACCLSQTETGIVAVRLSRLPVSLLPRAVLSVSALFAPPDSFVVVAAIHILSPASSPRSFPRGRLLRRRPLVYDCSTSCKVHLARPRANCICAHWTMVSSSVPAPRTRTRAPQLRKPFASKETFGCRV